MLDCFTFVNVTAIDISVDVRYHTLKLDELPSFRPLGKWYAESEAMYNIYRNKELYDDVDYIGFIHHDMDASNLDKSIIRELTVGKENELIIFQPYTFKEDYNQRILMDKDRPNTLRGKGRNCYETIFADYNQQYGTHHRTIDYIDQTIGLCSAFLLKTTLFDQLMEYASFIIMSGKLDIYDVTHKYRIQGGLLERYYASWFMLKGTKHTIMPLPHTFVGTHEQMTFLQIVRAYFWKLLRKIS